MVVFEFDKISRMKEAQSDQWYSFWKNLKEGYDFFEKTGIPPNVLVKDRKYVFEKIPPG